MARDYGYIISPSLNRYTFEAGKSVKGTFTLTNSFVTGEPEAQTFVLSVKFVFQENGNKYIYDRTPNGRQMYDMTSWITLSKQEVTLKQNQSIEIPYTINVPSDPKPGGKYAAIVIEKKNGLQQLASSGAALDDKVAYQILGKVAGEELRDSEVVSYTVNKPIFWMWPNEEATFTLQFKNKGNVEFLPSGDIFVHRGEITNSFWNTNFNQDQLVILPENERTYSVTWTPQKGLIKTDKTGITINLDYFRIGKYIATAKVGYDQNNNRVVADRVVSFWIIPIPLIAVLALVGVVTVLFLRFGRKKR